MHLTATEIAQLKGVTPQLVTAICRGDRTNTLKLRDIRRSGRTWLARLPKPSAGYKGNATVLQK